MKYSTVAIVATTTIITADEIKMIVLCVVPGAAVLVESACSLIDLSDKIVPLSELTEALATTSTLMLFVAVRFLSKFVQGSQSQPSPYARNIDTRIFEGASNVPALSYVLLDESETIK
jgi:hypothetical protein